MCSLNWALINTSADLRDNFSLVATRETLACVLTLNLFTPSTSLYDVVRRKQLILEKLQVHCTLYEISDKLHPNHHTYFVCPIIEQILPLYILGTLNHQNCLLKLLILRCNNIIKYLFKLLVFIEGVSCLIIYCIFL